MATLSNGINGDVRGKIGTVVGSSWKGKKYIKSLPKERTGKPSEGELINRKKFSISQAWLKPVLEFVRAGFKGYSQLSEGFVAAKSYLIKNAIEGEGLNLSINPAKVLVSHGDLPLPAEITLEQQGLKLIFTWSNAIPYDINGDDQVMMLAYNIKSGLADSTINGQFRHTGHHELTLEPGDGAEYHIYFAMVAADRSRQSNSVYLGTITV